MQRGDEKFSAQPFDQILGSRSDWELFSTTLYVMPISKLSGWIMILPVLMHLTFSCGIGIDIIHKSFNKMIIFFINCIEILKKNVNI